MSSAGVIKTDANFDVDINLTTGIITINDLVSAGDMADGDLVSLMTWQYAESE